jgi:hypothetical protein
MVGHRRLRSLVAWFFGYYDTPQIDSVEGMCLKAAFRDILLKS